MGNFSITMQPIVTMQRLLGAMNKLKSTLQSLHNLIAIHQCPIKVTRSLLKNVKSCIYSIPGIIIIIAAIIKLIILKLVIIIPRNCVTIAMRASY